MPHLMTPLPLPPPPPPPKTKEKRKEKKAWSSPSVVGLSCCCADFHSNYHASDKVSPALIAAPQMINFSLESPKI